MADALATILETTKAERLATGFGFTELLQMLVGGDVRENLAGERPQRDLVVSQREVHRPLPSNVECDESRLKRGLEGR